MKISSISHEFFSSMNRSFSLLNLWLGIAIVVSPGIAFSQPLEESVRPMSVVPTDEPELAPRPLPLLRRDDQEQQSLVPAISNEGKTTQPDSIRKVLDLQSQLSPR
jgi:hypothetical protein